MEPLVGHAEMTTNAQATEEDYQIQTKNIRLETIGGGKCTADAKVLFMLRDATETRRDMEQRLNHIKKKGEESYTGNMSGSKQIPVIEACTAFKTIDKVAKGDKATQ